MASGAHVPTSSGTGGTGGTGGSSGTGSPRGPGGARQPGPHAWRPGETVGGYRILKLLARGGMGEIHLAERLVPGEGGRYRVLKRLIGATEGIPEQAQMFRDEADLVSRLQHDNIVRVFEVGEWGGTYYIAMEYLHGADVGAILRQLLIQGRKLPIDHALQIALRAAAAMHHAHELVGESGQPLQIVHRDVSPQNLFVTFQGGVKLLDFGVARSARRDRETTTRSMKGKIAYMSPEQCLSRPLDRRSDVFSLGVILYELTLGTRLFRGNSDYELMQQIVQGQVVPPRTLDPAYPERLEEIVLRSLQKPVDKRYPTAEEMRRDLCAVAADAHLDVSGEALRRLMHDTFGDQPEAWRTLDEPPAPAPAAPLPSEGAPRKTVQMPGARPPTAKVSGTRVGVAPPPPAPPEVQDALAPPAPVPARQARASTPAAAAVPEPIAYEITRIAPAPQRPTAVARIAPRRSPATHGQTEQIASLGAPQLTGPPSWLRYPALGLLFMAVAGATFGVTRAVRQRLREPPSVVSEPVPVAAPPASATSEAAAPPARPAPRPTDAAAAAPGRPPSTPPAEGKGTLKVVASRHHAIFKLDGKRVGTAAPLSLGGLPAGREHLLEAALSPRGPWVQQRFLLQPDQTITVRLDLDASAPRGAPARLSRVETAPAPAASAPATLLARPAPTGTIRVVTRPPSTVLIDGVKFGATPVLATVPVGSHKVVLISPTLGRTRIVDVQVKSEKLASVDAEF